MWPRESDKAVVFVVDGDESVRRSLMQLFTIAGFNVQAFASPAEFLSRELSSTPACLVLDVRLPGLSGLELQERLAAAGRSIPIIFVSGHGTIPMTVQAIKAGAVDFLPKPIDEKALLAAVENAIASDRASKHRKARLAEIRRRFACLTPREKQVLDLVVRGRLNKQIAAELGTTEKTVKVHRGHVMKKMCAGSLAELIHLADELALDSSGS